MAGKAILRTSRRQALAAVDVLVTPSGVQCSGYIAFGIQNKADVQWLLVSAPRATDASPNDNVKAVSKAPMNNDLVMHFPIFFCAKQTHGMRCSRSVA